MLKRIKETVRFIQIKSLYFRYERFLIPGFLLFGFISDLIFFAFISFDFAIFTLSMHLSMVALGIVLINLYEDGILGGRFFAYLRLGAPLVLQFSFGALFSAFVIFYSFSGSVFASWPFLMILVFLMVGNEIFKKYNIRPDIQIAVFFFALFSFFNLSIPYLIRDLGPNVFFASGNIALLIAGLFIWVLVKNVPRVYSVRKTVIASIAGIFILMNIFYFTNLIPPIPLSIREIGAYYRVERAGDDYILTDRERGFFENAISKLPTFHEKYLTYYTGEAYVFSAVFAPPEMSLEIVHEWQFQNADGKWITKNRIPFTITGGRAGGFRGFSRVANIEPGKWRVNVKTKSGQIIGRYVFIAERTETPPKYIFETR